MAEDWAADVKKYVPDADDGVIAAIVRYCGIALHKTDSSLVAFSDPVELGRVKNNFLRKKLGLTDPDDVLDSAIAAVGERMKGDRTKNRVTVYYLLLDHLGLLHLFGGAANTASGAAGVAGAAAAAGIAGLGATAAGAIPPAPPPTPRIVESADARPQPAASRYESEEDRDTGGGWGWWPWLLLGLLALLLLWWLFLRHPAGEQTVVPANETNAMANAAATDNGAAGTAGNVVANITDLTTAPAEGTLAIPTGAGVVAETRDAKPVVKVYFDTGKADVAPAFAAAAGGLKAWLANHPGSTLAVSGFNDKTGNAALNAELSKNRAQAVKAELVAAGIADSAVALVKPEDTTDTSGTKADARRVEVVVH